MNGLAQYENKALEVVARELVEAKRRFPRFADDLFQAAALLGEEYGETCQAINDHHWEGKSLEHVITEAAQNAVVSLRLICMALLIQEARHAAN